MHQVALRPLAAIAAVAAVGALAGCAVFGPKAEIGAAIEKFGKDAVTAEVVGRITVEGGPKTAAIEIRFSLDRSKPFTPKGAVTIDADGIQFDSTTIGGDVYITFGGRSFVMHEDPKSLEQPGLGSFGPEQQHELMMALARSVDNVRKGQTTTGYRSQPLISYHATVNVDKVCDAIFGAFAPIIRGITAQSEGGGLAIGAKDCKSLFPTPPQLWFGVGGDEILRMLSFEISISGERQMRVIGRFDVTRFNQPVTIDAPANAEPMPNPLAGAAGT